MQDKLVISAHQTRQKSPRRGLRFALLTAVVLSSPAVVTTRVDAGVCDTLRSYVTWFRIKNEPILLEAQAETPNLMQTYDLGLLRASANAYKNFAERRPYLLDQSQSATLRLKPFIAFEQAVAKANSADPQWLDAFGAYLKGLPNSDAYAPYIYERLADFGPRSGDLFQWLTANHPAFANVFPVAGAATELVSFAFEKESHSDVVGDWYRLQSIPEDQWLSKTVKERADLLWDNKTAPIVKTSFCPEFLSNVKFEAPMLEYNQQGYNSGKPPAEFTLLGYELNVKTLFTQIDEVAVQFKEREAFHVHVVSTIDPNDSAGFQLFRQWWLKVNASAYLSGIEEGLHPSQLTKLPTLSTAPASIADINLNNAKFYGVGMRTKLYGSTGRADRVFIGLELRDISHDPTTLQGYTKDIATSLASRAWTKGTGAELAPLTLDPAGPAKATFTRELTKRGATPAEISAFIANEPNVTIPGHAFDTAPELAAADVEMFQLAQSSYFDEVFLTVAENRKFQAKGQPVEEEILRVAIRMSLTDWAKAARPSRLFRNF